MPCSEAVQPSVIDFSVHKCCVRPVAATVHPLGTSGGGSFEFQVLNLQVSKQDCLQSPAFAQKADLQ